MSMRTPAGTECRFYYEDYHRGHEAQECRLIQANVNSPPWKEKDCFQCPVPEILQANNSPHLVLEATVKKGVLGLGRKVEVNASCSRHLVEVPNPIVGCRECALERPGLEQLFGSQ